MRTYQAARRIRALAAVLALPLSVLIPPSIEASHVGAAPLTSVWSGSGPGNFTLLSDGINTPAQLRYDLGNDPSNLRFADETWTLQTTASASGTDILPYTYNGYHAYFQVRVHLDAFVTHNGVTTTTSLVHAGPVNCCTPPSGGFSYAGSHAFDVQEGDTYGFTFGGVNYDSDHHFFGTLTLAGPAPYTDAASVADNTSWTTAAPLTSAGIDGTLLRTGEARWFKFPVQPDSQVQVDLSNLDQNFDLTMFRDIGKTFTDLMSTKDLTTLSAQFAGDAYSPSIYSPSIYSPSIYSPSIYSPSIYSPSIYSPSIYSPSIYSPSIYSPSIYSPSIYSPSIYSPSIYSPSIYSPSQAFLQAFSAAQAQSLIGVSAREGADPESIRVSTWNNTGDFYVRVQGRNGAASSTPFHLALTTAGGPCTNVPLLPYTDLGTLAGTPGSASTVILTDSSRIGEGSGVGLTATLQALAGRTSGVVVDLAGSPRIAALNQQADTNSACPYAKNLVAEAIRDVVNSFRDTSGTLQYVVIAGGDSVVPFFRYPDTAGIGPESDYIPPARDDSASQASLRRNYVLGQDAYGSQVDLSLKGATMPVPDVAVGRLVETPDEIQGQVNSFLGLPGGVLPTPTSSLVTGYDFLTSAADSVQASFAAGLGATGRADTLITDQGVPTTQTTVGNTPTRDRSWTATDLSNALLGSHHDLVFLAGHFSANNALAADYKTSIATTDLDAHPGLLSRSLVISAGCHSAYNLLDGDGVPGLTLGLDWAEEMAKQQATFIGGTGYQYADTDFLAYSAKLYTLLATQLRYGSGPVALGPALLAAKQAYLSTVTTLAGIDQKALLESTLYGLPMTSLNLPSGRLSPPTATGGITPTPVSSGTPGAVLGLKSAGFDVSPQLTAPPNKPVLDLSGAPTQAVYHWWTGSAGVQSQPGLPALPKQVDDVTSTTGEVLRGVGFVSGTYDDAAHITPLTGAPTTEQNGVHTDFASPVFFPQRLATVNYFGALDANGADGRTRLVTTPAQYRSEPGTTTNTERTYSQLGLQLYYSANTTTYGSNVPGLAAPPSISGVSDTVVGNAVSVSAHVTGDPSAGIQKVWVTYTGETGPFHGSWQSVDLTQNPVDSTLWSGSIIVPAGQAVGDVRYILQAVNGVGLVTMDNNLGDGYTPGVPVGVPIPPATIPTSVTLDAVPSSGVSGDSVNVGATLTGAPASSPVTFTLGSTSTEVMTDGAGHASTTLRLQDDVGGYTIMASYAGDATHIRSSASAPFTITSVPTNLALTASATGINATLTRASTGAPLPQQTVYFTLTGPTSKSTTVTTDPQGVATLSVPVFLDGAYTVSAQFKGTPSTYLPSAVATGNFTVDTLPPTIAGMALTPASIAVGGSSVLSATISDATSSVSRVEYFVGTDPGVGLANAVPLAGGAVSVSLGANLAAGTYTVGLRAIDAFGNRTTSTATLTVTTPQTEISVSTNANRTGSVPLSGATVSGNIAVFASPPPASSGVAVVNFYLDDPNRTRAPYWLQLLNPYDLNGTLPSGLANMFDSRLLLNGSHTLTVEVVRRNGSVERRTVTFNVNNPAPTASQRIKVSTTATRTSPVDLNGRTVTGSVAIFVDPSTSVKSVSFWLDTTNLTTAPRSTDSSAPFDFNGTASNGKANLFNVGSLSLGQHRISARITYTNGTTAVLTSVFTRG